MKFSRNGNVYQVSRITGPAHNLLRLELSQNGATETKVSQLKQPQSTPEPQLGSDEIKLQVLRGVSDAAARFGKILHIATISYLPSDTPNPETYYLLAYSIVERISEEADFSVLTIA